MNKTILLIFMLFSTSAFSQIILGDNPKESNEKPTIEASKFKNIVGYGMFNATIIGYAQSCGFDNKNQELIYNSYYKKVISLKPSNNELQVINSNFFNTVNEAKKLGVANSKMTCEQFKIDFDKIISHLK